MGSTMTISAQTLLQQIDILSDGSANLRFFKRILSGDQVVSERGDILPVPSGSDIGLLLTAYGLLVTDQGFPAPSEDIISRVAGAVTLRTSQQWGDALNQIELGRFGEIGVRFMKTVQFNGSTINGGWHRATFKSGADVESEMIAINGHIAEMGFDAVTPEDIASIQAFVDLQAD